MFDIPKMLRSYRTDLKQFDYLIIPPDENEPIRKGVALMSPEPHDFELRRVIVPHLGTYVVGYPVLPSRRMVHMFAHRCGTLAGMSYNARATAIYRRRSSHQRTTGRAYSRSSGAVRGARDLSEQGHCRHVRPL